jgi:hypothetical protein
LPAGLFRFDVRLELTSSADAVLIFAVEQVATEAEVLGGIAVVAAVWIGAAGPVWTEAVAQVWVGIVGLDGIVVAPGVVVGLAEVEDDIAVAPGVAEPDAMSVLVVVGVQVWIAAARVEAAELVVVQDEFGVARDAVVVWDGPRVGPDGLVALAGGCWVRLDGRQAGRGDSFRRGVRLADRAGLVESEDARWAGRAG